MGIGAGWYEHEYDGYGYDFPKASVRIGQLEEGVEIMRRMWTEEVAEFDGKYYTLRGAINQPKPVQQPHIPFWIAGGGEKLTLRVAARYASYTNFGQSLDEFIHKSEVLRRHCEDVGRDYDSIVRSASFNVVCAETEREVEDRIQSIMQRHRPLVPSGRLERMGKMWRETAGTPEQLVAKLRPWAEAGLAYAIAYFPDAAYDSSGLERFARQVVPALP